jgi:hypothetical protein
VDVQQARLTSAEAVSGIVATAVASLLFAVFAVDQARSGRAMAVWLGVLALAGPLIAVTALVQARRSGSADVAHDVGKVLLIWACPALSVTMIVAVALLVFG